MSIQSVEPTSGLAPIRQTWSEVWLKAITQPSIYTYQDLVSRPGVSSRRAYAWVFLGSLVGSVLMLLGNLFFGSLSPLGAEQASDFLGGYGILILMFVCLLPVGGIFAILSLIIIAGISQVIARSLGGSGTYKELSYAFGAYLAPLGIIGSVLFMVPFVNWLTIPIGIYSVFLNILAIKSVHRFEWGKALASSVAIIAIILLLLAGVIIWVLVLLGPSIGDVFSNINQEIGTPVP